MDAESGMIRFSVNRAGANHGTDYCDCANQRQPTRQTWRDGNLIPTTPTPEPETMALAVVKWMFGKRTPWLLPSLPILAKSMARLAANARTAPSTAATMVSEILTAVLQFSPHG